MAELEIIPNPNGSTLVRSIKLIKEDGSEKILHIDDCITIRSQDQQTKYEGTITGFLSSYDEHANVQGHAVAYGIIINTGNYDIALVNAPLDYVNIQQKVVDFRTLEMCQSSSGGRRKQRKTRRRRMHRKKTRSHKRK
jgi:hypothetical protein